jgi:hypothetical protein
MAVRRPGSLSIPAASVITFRLVMDGSDLEVFVDGVSRITATDATYNSDAGQAGFEVLGTSTDDETTQGFQFETFRADTLASGPSSAAKTQYRRHQLLEAI